MHLSGKDFKKYMIFSLIFIWLVLFFHLFYRYLETVGEEKPVKGGVLIESIIKGNNNTIVNPIPYLGNNYYSKYIQSLLFKGCLNSFGSGDLCNVKTSDHKKYIVSLSGDNYWSDGRKITLDDVYFTFHDVIYQNSFNLQNPVANNISDIKKNDDNLEITFANASVNNDSIFKNYILPAHILKGKNKDFLASILGNLVNSTCVKIDLKSDYVNNVILDYSKCDNYYINKYQFILLDNQKQVSNLLTGKNKVDLYSAYENINPSVFSGFKVRLNKRYALFWNTKKQTNSKLKAYLSKEILNKLKDNLNINKKLDFNGYGLFVLPGVNLNKDEIKDMLSKEIITKKKREFEKQFISVGNVLNYKAGDNKQYFKKDSIKKYLTIVGNIGTGKYEKIGVSANGKTFKYVISEKFKNISSGKNVYTVYAYSGDNKTKIGEINLFYKNLNYPKFENIIPDFTIVYFNNGFIKTLGDTVSYILKDIYPGKVITKAVSKEEYANVIGSGNYDLVVSDINFDGKDISPLFKTNDPLSNPSNFANPNFASLINQDLLAPKSLKDKIFIELNKIYQESIPVVFIGNEKIFLFINKKYNPPKLDYSYFDNKKKFVKSVVINKIKQAAVKKISVSGFIDFLKTNIKNENTK